MANNRKVQGEIDKLMKKVTEGEDFYNEVYDKFTNAPNQQLKERFEGDLKKEIKKLQRLREQIKGFIANPDVKDKKNLEGSRRSIEEKMEDFKVCERETKTKAYSKEGLANNRNDPADTPLARTEQWIKEAINVLKEQVETSEFEIQSEGGPKKGKGKKSDDPREVRLGRLRFYTVKLEQLLRMVTNEELAVEEVDHIEEGVQRFIDENADDDFQEETELFDEFDLPDVVIKDDPTSPEAPTPATVPKAVTTPKTAPVTIEKEKQVKAPLPEKVKEVHPETVKVAVPAVRVPVVLLTKKPETPTSVSVKGKASPGTPLAVKPTAAEVARGFQKPAPPTPTTPSNIPVNPSALSLGDEEYSALDDDMDAANDDTFGDGVTSTGTLADLATMTLSSGGVWDKGRPTSLQPSKQQQSPLAVKVSQQPPVTPSTPAATIVAAPIPLLSGGFKINLLNPNRKEELQLQLRMLDISARNLPQIADVERIKPVPPPNPHDTPEYYPQTIHRAFNDPEIFKKFESDTLFFIFYYQQQTFLQYQAAKELKRQGFRYHRKFHTWFQRHEKPKNTNEESEQGSYIYFDYENGWCQRIKSDFTFKYVYLEDELE